MTSTCPTTPRHHYNHRHRRSHHMLPPVSLRCPKHLLRQNTFAHVRALQIGFATGVSVRLTLLLACIFVQVIRRYKIQCPRNVTVMLSLRNGLFHYVQLFGWLLVLPTVARLQRSLPPSVADIALAAAVFLRYITETG